jgi:hypothetical protein
LEADGKIMRHPPQEARAAALTKANEDKAAAVRVALGKPGRCGSWTCRDPDCQVPRGQCHHCSDPAELAPQSDRRKRWVAGKPMLCCSKHGPMWITKALADGRARGLRTGREAAGWLAVADITPYVRAGLLKPDERGPGRLMWFSEQTLKGCERKLARGRGHLDKPQAAERHFDVRWLPRLARTDVASALASRDEAKARTARRQRQRAARRGRKPSQTPLSHHTEWLRSYEALRDEMQENYSERRELGLLADGEQPPKTWHVLLAVAERDWSQHRERWPGYRASSIDPESMHPDDVRKAAQRVLGGIKTACTRLQIELV